MSTEPGTITFTGPDDVPDLYVPERVMDDGTIVPARTIDMSGYFRLSAETVCRCGLLYGHTVLGHKDVVVGWPAMAQRYQATLRREVERAIAECTNCEGRTP